MIGDFFSDIGLPSSSVELAMEALTRDSQNGTLAKRGLDKDLIPATTWDDARAMTKWMGARVGCDQTLEEFKMIIKGKDKKEL